MMVGSSHFSKLMPFLISSGRFFLSEVPDLGLIMNAIFFFHEDVITGLDSLKMFCKKSRLFFKPAFEPIARLELATYALRMRCSTN